MKFSFQNIKRTRLAKKGNPIGLKWFSSVVHPYSKDFQTYLPFSNENTVERNQRYASFLNSIKGSHFNYPK